MHQRVYATKHIQLVFAICLSDACIFDLFTLYIISFKKEYDSYNCFERALKVSNKNLVRNFSTSLLYKIKILDCSYADLNSKQAVLYTILAVAAKGKG